MTTVNTAHGYPDDRLERRAVRKRHIDEAIREENLRRRTPECGEGLHRGRGCADDGRTCLCPCHDGQRAWKWTG